MLLGLGDGSDRFIEPTQDLDGRWRSRRLPGLMGYGADGLGESLEVVAQLFKDTAALLEPPHRDVRRIEDMAVFVLEELPPRYRQFIAKEDKLTEVSGGQRRPIRFAQRHLPHRLHAVAVVPLEWGLGHGAMILLRWKQSGT